MPLLPFCSHYRNCAASSERVSSFQGTCRCCIHSRTWSHGRRVIRSTSLVTIVLSTKSDGNDIMYELTIASSDESSLDNHEGDSTSPSVRDCAKLSAHPTMNVAGFRSDLSLLRKNKRSRKVYMTWFRVIAGILVALIFSPPYLYRSHISLVIPLARMLDNDVVQTRDVTSSEFCGAPPMLAEEATSPTFLQFWPSAFVFEQELHHKFYESRVLPAAYHYRRSTTDIYENLQRKFRNVTEGEYRYVIILDIMTQS